MVDALTQQPEVAVIISLKEKETPSAPPNVPTLIQHAAAKQQRVLSVLSPSDFTLTRQYQAVPALAGRITARGVEKLAAHPDVISIGIDGEVYASLDESVPLINADDVHLLGVTGEGVEVAVLDTGIDTDHPDLADDTLSENCFLSGSIPCHNGEATDSGPGSAEDDAGHGSRVSGIVTSAGVVAPVGVAPDAGIRAYKVLNSNGSGRESDIIAALDHIIVNHPSTDLVNMSLGDGLWHGSTCDTHIPAMTAAIDTLKAGGTTVVAASGNDGFKGGIGHPACISNVISVGMTYDETFESASCSGAPCTDSPATVDTVVCCSNSSPWLNLLAPGALITSSTIGGGSATGRGTSFAAPHVVGVAALLLEGDPTLAPFQLEYCLESTGVPITDAANGLTTPRVDALAALSCTPPPEPTPTPTPTPILPYALHAPNLDDPGSFGSSLAMGDVNGDGKADIAAGARFEDVGDNERQGRAYVFSGVDTSLLFTLDSPNPQASALFGWSVAMGEVNGDGKEDIAVGARLEDVGDNENEGRAYVYSGADGSLLFTLDTPNPQEGANFGYSLTVGDVNGDGKGDIAVGATGEGVGGNEDQGRAYVYSGADGSLLLTLDTPNPQADAWFGSSVAVGDVNGDGRGDIAVGADGEWLSMGWAYVFSGADGALLFTLYPPNPQMGAWFGSSVAVGDVNGNGRGDIVVGAPNEDVGANEYQGRAYVFSGTDGSLLFTLDIFNPQASAYFGYSLAVGDANGDGKGDIAVGAFGEDVGSSLAQGRAYVFSGTDGSLFSILDILEQPRSAATFGQSVAVGDVNDDGEEDIAVGAPNAATVYVFAGGASSPIPTPPPGFLLPYSLDSPNPQPGAYFGNSVAVGDVNDDGKGDIAVGAPKEDGGGNTDQGRAYVYSGADTSLLFTLDTPNPQRNAHFGSSVAVGDVDGDGKADIAGGAYWEDVGDNEDQGRAYVFSGADGSLLFTLDSPNPQPGAYFGYSVAVGDVNDDEKGDIAVGAPKEDVGGNLSQGRVYVFSGVDGSLLFTVDIPNPQAVAWFGWSVAVGDTNGDDIGDVAVGAPKERVGDNADQGRAHVFSGADGSLLFSLDSANPQADPFTFFGGSVAVGDANGDGKGDITVGAPNDDVGDNLSQGRAYVFSGANGSLLFTLDTPNPQMGAWFGQSVAVGDVNGDGRGDIAVGALGEDVSGNQEEGRAYVFSGADSSLLFSLDNPDHERLSGFGQSVAVGDTNGDGNGDIAGGAPQGGIYRGIVYVLASDPEYSPTPTPTPSPTPLPPVGGIAELPGVSDSSGRNHIALAGLAAAALLALSAGAWYARRRWLG